MLEIVPLGDTERLAVGVFVDVGDASAECEDVAVTAGVCDASVEREPVAEAVGEKVAVGESTCSCVGRARRRSSSAASPARRAAMLWRGSGEDVAPPTRCNARASRGPQEQGDTRH